MVVYLFQAAIWVLLEIAEGMVGFMGIAGGNDIVEKRKPSIFRRILAVLLVTALLIGAAAYGGLYVVMNGPSAHAKEQLISVAADNAVGIAVLHLFMSTDMIEQWQQKLQDEVPDGDDGGSETLFSVYPRP